MEIVSHPRPERPGVGFRCYALPVSQDLIRRRGGRNLGKRRVQFRDGCIYSIARVVAAIARVVAAIARVVAATLHHLGCIGFARL